MKVECGGYRKRKLRTLNGIEETRLKRLRCAGCKRQIRVEYTPECQRYRWYSRLVQGLFAILDSYRVTEAVKADIAALLGYPIVLATRLDWAQSGGDRGQTLLKAENAQIKGLIRTVCVDDWVYGRDSRGQGYGVWEAQSGCPVSADLAEERGFERVRDLLSDGLLDDVVSDGAPEIAEALHWLGSKVQQVRCWFHLSRDILGKTPQDQRNRLQLELQVLLEMKTLGEAEANNTAEVGNGRLWRRQKRRNIRSIPRAKDWLQIALYRTRHRPIQHSLSAWQRLSNQSSPKCWFLPIITPLRYSTEFFR
ncbi:hypothetical protein [Meiothermus sp.]|uniref:hypothetical protein n=1 Tax=Meiothermus sp. TaxID=1955249 RepID=UPI0026332BA1|nr:hypothetical protein [Meiothermus sp.]